MMTKKGFTLIELLVGISISTILMISVGVLISGGIKNITTQEKIIKNSGDFSDFENELNNIFTNIDTTFQPIITNSGVIVKINQEYDKGGFAYIGESISNIDPTSGNGIYCNSGSENPNTNHIFIKTFIPDYDIDIQKSHKINGIGKGIFGLSNHLLLGEGIELNKIYLNNPTGTTSGTINGDTIEFISDTLNNRILYKSGSLVYELLNKNDGLLEPTGLSYNSINNSLYIANSGKGEILKYSSKKYSTIPNLTLTGITVNNINNFEIAFYNKNGNFNINNSTSINNISFTNYTKQSGDSININNNKLIYSFSGGISKNLSDVDITINNLSDFSGTGTYYVKLDINNKIYPYFTQGDDNILTKSDNTLEIIATSNKYPTKIDTSGTITSKFIDSNYNSYFNYNNKYDYILKTPIDELNINWDSSKKLLNFELKYYKKYNCYNTDENIERTFILKKNYK